MADEPQPCFEQREALELLATGTFAAQEPEVGRAEQHAKSCAACAAFLQSRRELWTELKRASQPEQAVDTRHALVLVKNRMEHEPQQHEEIKGVPLDPQQREGKGPGVFVGGFALGAGLLVAAIVLFENPLNKKTLPETPAIPVGPAPTTLNNPNTPKAEPSLVVPNPSTANYKDLKLELILQPDTKGAPRAATARLSNTGKTPAQVAAFHPLGANYELELRRPGEVNPEFIKLAPRALRKIGHALDGSALSAVLEATRGTVHLQPGEAYELELDVRELLKNPGEYHLSFHYLGFEHPGMNLPGTAGATGNGAMLRSSECVANVK